MNGSDDHKASDNGATIWFMAVIILCIVSSCTVYAPRIVQDSTQPVAGRPITTVSVLQSGDSVQILRTDSLSMVRSVAGRVKQVAGDTVYVRQASSDSLITIRKSDRVTLIEQLRRDQIGPVLGRGGWLREVHLCYGRDFMPERCPRGALGPADNTSLKIWRGL